MEIIHDEEIWYRCIVACINLKIMIIFNSNVESDWKGVNKYWKSAFKLAMIEFSPLNSRALLPTLPTNYPDGSHS